ncbi:MAG TPA: hypothetical protein VJM50_22670, partial [Pyrinomonadaceae bacterium]|nr:hypothetical protein [Pyrinomonadaceae bacterium]
VASAFRRKWDKWNVMSEEQPDSASETAVAEPALSAEVKAIVEALIFASPEPVTPKMLYKLLADEPKEEYLVLLATLLVVEKDSKSETQAPRRR